MRDLLDGVRRICARLPGAVEEAAWVGTRWKVRNRTFAHVVAIDGGWPPAYAKAAGTAGPATVVTFRSNGFLYEALRTAGPPYFEAAWGTTWGTHVIGMVLDADVDWNEVEVVVAESHRLLAPKPASKSTSTSAPMATTTSGSSSSKPKPMPRPTSKSKPKPKPKSKPKPRPKSKSKSKSKSTPTPTPTSKSKPR